MSTIIRCDKCGKMGDIKQFKHIRGYELTDATHYKTEADDHIEVCKKCYKNIFNREEK